MNNDIEQISCVSCTSKSVCFEKLSLIELENVNIKRTVLNYRKGEVISKQGSFVTHILFVKRGLTKVYKEINDNHNLILNLYPQGSLIGLPALFSNEMAQYSVAAIEDTTICTIDIKIFEELVVKNGEFASNVISTINNCENLKFNKIISLTQKHHNGRLAEALLFISDKIYNSSIFKLSLSRKDLAEFTGMSAISVVRILKDFNQDGIINSSGKSIEILDFKRLERISESG
ncbi:MAG: Crp/Fnr family transcriptional regulator [Saprospiraceae bacterium]|nr:Crp/Fnr family transcriptional regulator [Saprospiraceae bacterium]